MASRGVRCAAAVVLAVAGLAAGCGDDDGEAPSAAATIATTATGVDDDRFWKLVEASRASADGDVEAQATDLRRLLRRLAPADIAAFGDRLDRRMDESYRWDLWAAAFIVNGGCSDDCFDYFRSWLIAQGRVAYERALARPQSVGELVEPGQSVQAESFGYAHLDAYEVITGGREPPDPARPAPAEPTGDEWSEETVDRLYPELARRFGLR